MSLGKCELTFSKHIEISLGTQIYYNKSDQLKKIFSLFCIKELNYDNVFFFSFRIFI